MKHSLNKNTGKLGEDIACKYLEDNHFVILERNYRKNFAEIDIIAKKWNIIHIIEVKSVSRARVGAGVTHETHNYSVYRPEDNVHISKLDKIITLAECFMNNNYPDLGWQIDVITVTMFVSMGIIKDIDVTFIENV